MCTLSCLLYRGDNPTFQPTSKKYLKTDKAFHIYKHLNGSDACLSDCFEECFKTTDLSSTAYDLEYKEALHILWENLTLNTQVKYFNIKLSF